MLVFMQEAPLQSHPSVRLNALPFGKKPFPSGRESISLPKPLDNLVAPTGLDFTARFCFFLSRNKRLHLLFKAKSIHTHCPRSHLHYRKSELRAKVPSVALTAAAHLMVYHSFPTPVAMPPPQTPPRLPYTLRYRCRWDAVGSLTPFWKPDDPGMSLPARARPRFFSGYLLLAHTWRHEVHLRPGRLQQREAPLLLDALWGGGFGRVTRVFGNTVGSKGFPSRTLCLPAVLGWERGAGGGAGSLETVCAGKPGASWVMSIRDFYWPKPWKSLYIFIF